MAVWEISASYRPGGDSENPFFASPWEVSQRIMNLTATTHRKFVLVLAYSAIFHMVFPIDSTLMLMTQLWSMCPCQYFNLPVCLRLFPALNQRDVWCLFHFHFLTMYFTWVNTNNVQIVFLSNLHIKYRYWYMHSHICFDPVNLSNDAFSTTRYRLIHLPFLWLNPRCNLNTH